MDLKDCLFCRICNGDIPATRLYEDDHIVAFTDIHPVAPVHFLVIPRAHIETLDDVESKHASLIGHMLVIASRLAREQGIGEDGYRQVINCRSHGGQVVYHLHVHIIGGRTMGVMG